MSSPCLQSVAHWHPIEGTRQKKWVAIGCGVGATIAPNPSPTNVNVVGGPPGLTTGYGPSHQATEDLAILRGIPGLTIVDPCDSVDIEQAVPALATHPGPTYLRLLRGNVPTVLDQYDYRFELGQAADTDRLIVTMENHTIIGGLAESVAATLAFAGKGQRIVPIALPDEFLAAGALPTLHDRYGLSTEAVVATVRAEYDRSP